MSKLGKELLIAFGEVIAIARGEADSSSYRLAVPVVSTKQSPLNPTRWCCTLQCHHDVWVTSKRRPKVRMLDCQRCKDDNHGGIDALADLLDEERADRALALRGAYVDEDEV